jgi:hypothetical protein
VNTLRPANDQSRSPENDVRTYEFGKLLNKSIISRNAENAGIIDRPLFVPAWSPCAAIPKNACQGFKTFSTTEQPCYGRVALFAEL